MISTTFASRIAINKKWNEIEQPVQSSPTTFVRNTKAKCYTIGKQSKAVCLFSARGKNYNSSEEKKKNIEMMFIFLKCI
jgi:hypothetical protein